MMEAAQTTSSGAEAVEPRPEWLQGLVDAVGIHWSAAIGIGGCVVAYYAFRLFVVSGLERLSHTTDNDLDDRLVQFVRKFSIWVFLFFGVLWVLKTYEIDISPLLAGAGIAGIALGFAAKELLSDILAGMSLIADRPLRLGDRVKIERIGTEWGSWGDVVDIGLRRTRIRNSDGIIVNYPNSVLSASVITNFSFEPVPIRVRVRFQLPFDSDIEKAIEVGSNAIQRTDRVIEDSAEIVVRSVWDVTRGHQTGGVLLEGRYRIEDVRRRTKVRSAVLRNLIADLRAAGIELAVQVIDVRK